MLRRIADHYEVPALVPFSADPEDYREYLSSGGRSGGPTSSRTWVPTDAEWEHAAEQFRREQGG